MMMMMIGKAFPDKNRNFSFSKNAIWMTTHVLLARLISQQLN
jgi:hypothetical protein